jgi:tellurite resistance protein
MPHFEKKIMKYSELFKHYSEERGTVLSENQFASLLLMYPSVLVASSDGDFDALERQNLAISCFSAAGENDLLFAAELYCELMYCISKEGGKWKNLFFDVMKENLSNDSESKLLVMDLMTSIAESSDGVSNEEKETIANIKQTLNL